MANSNNRLKAYVRYDGSGRVIAGSLILQRFKPKVGNWQEIDAHECCNPVMTTTTTTTAIPYFTWLLAVGDSSANACAALPTTDSFYTSVDTLGIGVLLYTDTVLTTYAPNGWYASGDSNTAYQVVDGEIVAEASCGV